MQTIRLLTLACTLLLFSTSHASLSMAILDSSKAGPIVNSPDATADLNSYYNDLVDASSSVVTGEVTSSILTSLDFFVVMLPDNIFSASEVTALNNFLSAGKHLLIIGEQNTFAPTENGFINTLLSSLGSSMALGTNSIGSGLSNTASSQILADPLTAGVSTLNYGNTNTIVGGTSVLLTPDSNNTWAAYESVSNGRVTLLADSNLISNIELSNNDNGVFLENIALASVPEPNAYAFILGSVTLLVCWGRRH